MLFCFLVPSLTAVKGTMKIHQIMSTSPGKMKYRDVTCLCEKERGVMDCPYFDLKEVTLQDVVALPPPWRPEVISSDYIGRWCVLRYLPRYHNGCERKQHPGQLCASEWCQQIFSGLAPAKMSVGVLTVRCCA